MYIAALSAVVGTGNVGQWHRWNNSSYGVTVHLPYGLDFDGSQQKEGRGSAKVTPPGGELLSRASRLRDESHIHCTLWVEAYRKGHHSRCRDRRVPTRGRSRQQRLADASPKYCLLELRLTWTADVGAANNDRR
jgi:hypothetical protein